MGKNKSQNKSKFYFTKKEKLEEEENKDENEEKEEQEEEIKEKEEVSEDEEIADEEPEEEKENAEENNEEGNQEGEKEPPKKFVAFKDRDYILRVPAKKYYTYKMIETLAMSASSTNPKLKSYIVCPGLIYGCEETIFYEYYKYAWLNSPEKLPILANEQFNGKNAGKNSIPTIHIYDLVNAIKRIADKKPAIKYIFAVDRTKNRQLKRIITAISKSVGNGKVEVTEDKDKIPSFDFLNIDIRVKTSKIFEDVRGDEEEEEDFLKRCFKWHCEVFIFLFSSVLKVKERN